jgi:hypothetical protein
MAGGKRITGQSPVESAGKDSIDQPDDGLALAAALPAGSAKKVKYSDALSVFGQFSVNADQGTNTTIGLGKFFATGLAARNLAAGFRDWQRQGLKPLPPTPAP